MLELNNIPNQVDYLADRIEDFNEVLDVILARSLSKEAKTDQVIELKDFMKHRLEMFREQIKRLEISTKAHQAMLTKLTEYITHNPELQNSQGSLGKISINPHGRLNLLLPLKKVTVKAVVFDDCLAQHPELREFTIKRTHLVLDKAALKKHIEENGNTDYAYMKTDLGVNIE